MSLGSYASDPFLYEGSGSVAVDVPVRVVFLGTDILVPIFYNSEGTPKPNPLRTDSEGVVRFWSDPGDYELVANGERTSIEVIGESTDPDLEGIVFEQAAASTSWTINHGLGYIPVVTVVIANEVVDADVLHPVEGSTTVINFGNPQSGKAVLS